MQVRVDTWSRRTLAALLALLLAAALLAGSPATSGAAPAPDAAEGPSPLGRATYRLHVLSANLDGAEGRVEPARKTATVQALVRGTQADVVLLQEVCWSQYRQLVRDNRAWIRRGEGVADHFRFQRLRRHPGCSSRGGYQRHGLVIASRHRLSDAASYRLPNDRARTPHLFRLFCADVAVTDGLVRFTRGAVRACVTQLRAGRGRNNGAGRIRRKQARHVRASLAPVVRADRAAVVLAGDFNAQPQKGTMSQLYRLTRTGRLGNPKGRFYEADQNGRYGPAPAGHRAGAERIVCRVDPDLCRWGEPTHHRHGLGRKLDYVFFSVNRARPVPTSPLPGTTRPHLSGALVPSPTSTHDVYRAWADLELDLG